MIVTSIENGVVIDHIPAGKAKRLYHHLDLEELDCQIALIENADSKKLGKKDILKVATLIDINYDLLGYFEEHITVSIIKDGDIVEKVHPEPPERLKNVLKCKNPRCITSIEQELDHEFVLTDPKKKTYRCIYCDTIGKREDI